MQSLLKISDAVNLAMHASAIMAGELGRPISAKELAHRLAASEATLSKAMQRLVRADLLSSTRGPAGGFFLAREAKEITLKEIVEAIEGKLSTPGCLFGRQICGRSECILGDSVALAHGILEERLASTTLDQISISLNGAKHQKRKVPRKPIKRKRAAK